MRKDFVYFSCNITPSTQGAIISSSISMGLSYCCCTATNTICQSCLGSTAEYTTGRKRSVLLLSVGIVLALYFQYTIGPGIVTDSKASSETTSHRTGFIKKFIMNHHTTGIYNAWYTDCHDKYERSIGGNETEDIDARNTFITTCGGNAGVYRTMFITTMFFLLSAIATKVSPVLNRQIWPAKFVVRESLLK